MAIAFQPRMGDVKREGADAGTMKLDDFVKWFKAEVAKELE